MFTEHGEGKDEQRRNEPEGGIVEPNTDDGPKIDEAEVFPEFQPDYRWLVVLGIGLGLMVLTAACMAGVGYLIKVAYDHSPNTMAVILAGALIFLVAWVFALLSSREVMRGVGTGSS